MTVARPPMLAGREDVWARMEEAWAKGQVVYIAGVAGIGKSRLVHDFAGSKVPRVRWNAFQARPDDATAPYATLAELPILSVRWLDVWVADDGQVVDAAIHVELGPLSSEAVEALLASTAVDGATAFAATLHRIIGGYPLFVVETLEGLLEAGDLDTAELETCWPPPRRPRCAARSGRPPTGTERFAIWTRRATR